LVARLAIASLFPFSLYFAYLIGKKLRSRSLGWLNLILLAINALALLHTRRAMAESALLAGALFTLWGVVSWERRRFWLALPAALAFNAKYSALPLALIGLAAVLWDFPSRRIPVRIKLLHSGLYAVIFIGITALLNPFFWRAPVPALQEAFAQRTALIQAQSEEFSKTGERFILDTPVEKGVALLAKLFFAPPAIHDVENYVEDLAPTTEKYLANPLHHLLTGWVGGTLVLLLTLAGLVMLSFRICRDRSAWRAGILLVLAFLLQLGGILTMIRFPFQRYYLPLIPYITILVAYFLSTTIDLLISSRRRRIRSEIP
jgi:4-amino-4-deoxy-L-arabinose transferase-like glycosyltransferase